jgi:hypothetical protein
MRRIWFEPTILVFRHLNTVRALDVSATAKLKGNAFPVLKLIKHHAMKTYISTLSISALVGGE